MAMRGWCLRRYAQDRKGATAVEVAFTMPFFIMILLVLFEATIFFFASSNAEQALHNYSRNLVLMANAGRTSDHIKNIKKELETLINPKYFLKLTIDVDTATSTSDFTKKLTASTVAPSAFKDKTKPIYVRAVFERRQFSYGIFEPLWRVIGDSDIGGLFSPIDLLIVIPFPTEP